MIAWNLCVGCLALGVLKKVKAERLLKSSTAETNRAQVIMEGRQPVSTLQCFRETIFDSAASIIPTVELITIFTYGRNCLLSPSTVSTNPPGGHAHTPGMCHPASANALDYSYKAVIAYSVEREKAQISAVSTLLVVISCQFTWPEVAENTLLKQWDPEWSLLLRRTPQLMGLSRLVTSNRMGA